MTDGQKDMGEVLVVMALLSIGYLLDIAAVVKREEKREERREKKRRKTQ